MFQKEVYLCVIFTYVKQSCQAVNIFIIALMHASFNHTFNMLSTAATTT